MLSVRCVCTVSPSQHAFIYRKTILMGYSKGGRVVWAMLPVVCSGVALIGSLVYKCLTQPSRHPVCKVIAPADSKLAVAGVRVRVAHSAADAEFVLGGFQAISLLENGTPIAEQRLPYTKQYVRGSHLY